MTILIDIDNTINDLSKVLLESLNKFTIKQELPNYEDITDYDWFDRNYSNPWYSTQYHWFWNRVTINPEAIRVIESWVEKGIKILFVSASHFNEALGYKIRKVLNSFNSNLINEKNIVITQDKSLIHGDIMIDDYIGNLENFEYIKICFAQPWNKDFDENKHLCYRLNDWNKINYVVEQWAKIIC